MSSRRRPAEEKEREGAAAGSVPALRSLILSASQGDEAAFGELASMYSPLLEASVAPYRGRLSKEDVEEISQEALLSFHRAVKTFDPLYGDTGFGLYAKTCVANGVRDALRRIARGARLSTVPLEDTLPAGLGDDPAGSYIAEESAAELRARIRGALSPFENTVWWSHYSGMSCAEIAAASGRSVKSVNNALCRVRQKLRRLLS